MMKKTISTIAQAPAQYSKRELYEMIKYNKSYIDNKLTNISKDMADQKILITNQLAKDLAESTTNNNWKILTLIGICGSTIAGIGAMIKSDFDNKFDKMDAKIDKLETKVDKLDDKLNEIDNKLGDKLNELDKKLSILIATIAK